MLVDFLSLSFKTKGRSVDDKLEKLKEMTALQCRDGNWNYDPYMHGMANGMIFSRGLMEAKEPKFLDAPKEWLRDRRFIGFQAELKTLINRSGIENTCDIPDFLLAELICGLVKEVGKSSKKNLDWHGCDSVCHPKPNPNRRIANNKPNERVENGES